MTASAGQNDAASVSRQEAQQQLDLFNIGYPGMKAALNSAITDLGAPGSEPQVVKDAFAQINQQNQAAFDMAEKSAPLTLAQESKQTYGRTPAGAVSGASDKVLSDLEVARRSETRALAQQETDAALSQQDTDLSTILGISQGGVSGALNFAGNRLALDKLDNANPWAGAIAGASSGASIGSVGGLGWGTLIGAVAGGALGYFSGSGG